MSKKKLIVFFIIGAFTVLGAFKITNIINGKIQEKYIKEHYIFDKDFRIGQKRQDNSTGKYFSDGFVTAETLKFFKSLEQRFEVHSVDQLNDHFNNVRKYLKSQFKESEAQRLFGIYKDYLKCEIELGTNERYRAKTPDTLHILILLNRIQNFRRDRLGKETADALFGSDVKEREYMLRRSLVIRDESLYGKEKEMRLQKLKREMWDDGQISFREDGNSYNRYQLKIQLYQRDLSEMSERERELKIDESRKEFFSNEIIRRLIEVDNQVAKEKNNIDRYHKAEQVILNLKNITQEEKNKRIKSLQDEFFGKEAEAFRRKEVMRREAQK